MNNPNNIPNNGLVYSPIQQPASSSMLNTDNEMEGVVMSEASSSSSAAHTYQQQQSNQQQQQQSVLAASTSQQLQNTQLNYSIEHPLGKQSI